MTGLRILSYMFTAAGIGALALVGLNALGLDLMGETAAGYVEPGTDPTPRQR